MSEVKEEQKELDLVKVQESADGSAVVEMPADMIGDEPEQKPVQAAPKVEDNDSDDDDDDHDGEEMADGGSLTPEQEAVRDAKRAKRKARKEFRKQAEAERLARLQNLEREIQELREKNSILERKTHGSELARIDAAIQEQENRIAFAKQKVAQAVEAQDGSLVTSANDMLYEARRNLEALQNFKKRAVAPTPQRTIQPPDPVIQRYAKDWMERNPWYNPNGRDPDSKIALTIDNQLTEEGYDPKSSEYWAELDARLPRYLPHRYTEVAEEKSVQRKPRAVVTGSGRENATSNGNRPGSFTLTPEQVRAMKDAGMWDDPEKRLRMIKRYAENSRQQRS